MGDREAQRTLYVRTSDRIYQLLLRMTGSHDTAFDLTQETYLRAFTRISQFDGRSSVATWLYRIGVTEALQLLRRAKRIRGDLTDNDAEASVASAAEQSDLRLDVGTALAALDPTDRSVLLLRYQQGLDYRAIAEIVGCAEGTVASGLNRARQRLRQRLGKSYAPREETEPAKHPKDRVPKDAGATSTADARRVGQPSPEGTSDGL
jgi:RNA polymerase sigma-70 factor (ECF subfamily)